MEKFLSICITSYNRPDQLKRCLDSVVTNYIDRVEIIIGDDCSPKKEEISEIVNIYKKSSKIQTTLLQHPVNIGYDGNFYCLTKKATGDYLLFVTDDDSLLPNSIDEIIETLKAMPTAVAFTPFFDRNQAQLCRVRNRSFVIERGISSVERHLYDSILLSGLIFARSKIPAYQPDQLFGLIYSQVYVFICIMYQYGGAYLNIPTIEYIGDGENGFGSNDGEECNPLLADRAHYLSNIEYNKRLVRIINLFDERFGTNLFASISRKYSVRTITGFCYARSFGSDALKEYMISVQKVGFDLGIWPHVYYYLLRIFGVRVISAALNLVKSLRQKW